MSGKFDIVIAGASISGSIAAYLLGKLGIKVLLIDIKPYDTAGDKPCGDALGKHHLDELGLEPPRKEEVEGIVRGVDVYSPSEDAMYRIYGDGYMINRVKFVQKFISKAVELGVTYMDRTMAYEPIIKKDRVVGIKLWKKGRGFWNVEANLVIDATGMSRYLLNKLPSSWPLKEKFDLKDVNITYREVRICRRDINEPNFLRIFINKNIRFFVML